MGHGRRRESRAAEDGLPRPAQPDHAGNGRADHQRAPSRGARRHRPASPGRPDGLRALAARRNQGRLPARELGHSRPAGQDEARPVRRHHRDQCALPAGPAQRRHGRRVRGRQERPEAGDLHSPHAQGGARGNLRGDGLPGTGDADPQPAGWHRAIQGLCHDQGDLQEEGRHHRREPWPVRPGGRRARAGSREGAEDLRPDRILRRLRLQQVAQHGLRAGGLPDGLSEESLSHGVHGRGAVVGDGRRRARQVLRRAHRRLPADGHRGAAAQRQRGWSGVPGWQGRSDPLRLGRDQGGRREGRRGDRQGARSRRGPSRAWTISSSASRPAKWAAVVPRP